jgi:hypothetical protein
MSKMFFGEAKTIKYQQLLDFFEVPMHFFSCFIASFKQQYLHSKQK